jgi:hypothetical protein
VENGRIKKVFYPAFPPDKSAATVLDWLNRGGLVERTKDMKGALGK